ncbi:hypothetical protein C8R43DRAFT_1121070 [Mycena crocata]|nr:hypothetical protein C8R43DRAFT_1121070 [Mycena crocata]
MDTDIASEAPDYASSTDSTESEATDYASSVDTDDDGSQDCQWGSPQSDRTISDIDRDYEADGQCDLCSIPLGPHIDPEARAFRCCHCELGIQCEKCFAEAHWGVHTHIVQEWQCETRAWGPRQMLNDHELAFNLVKSCGSCCVEIAPANSMMPPGTILCETCGLMLLCARCCRSEHRREPLHKIKVWEGGWEESTLRAEGFVYQLGHGGQACLSPEEPSRPMLVIDISGCQTVQVKFCGCGRYDEGESGNWKQILDNGWFESSLVHPAACATFKVLECSGDFIRRSVWM